MWYLTKNFPIKYAGAINCIMTFGLKTEDNISTRVSGKLNYQDYLRLFNRAVDAFSNRRFEREAEIVLANFKKYL
jgi:hypothetical protein